MDPVAAWPPMAKRFGVPHAFAACLLLAVTVGCLTSESGVTTKITNITPTLYPRNTTALYRVEMIWESNQKALRPETIAPEVRVVGHTNVYPMKRTPLLSNRWETLIGPLQPDETNLFYSIKVNWKYNTVPIPRANSLIKGPFRLRIVD